MNVRGADIIAFTRVMRHHFHAEQWLPYTVETVFAFFADPANLPRLMPGWQKARIDEATLVPPPSIPLSTASSTGVFAGDTSRILLSFRPVPFFPLRIRWDARISKFAFNQRFCDTQFRGPFAYWHHCHSVMPAASPGGVPGTHLQDAVEYELLFGPLGALSQPLVRLQLASMFKFRRRRTLELLAALK